MKDRLLKNYIGEWWRERVLAYLEGGDGKEMMSCLVVAVWEEDDALVVIEEREEKFDWLRVSQIGAATLVDFDSSLHD